jgi:lipopolysaccharide transport system permease protein
MQKTNKPEGWDITIQSDSSWFELNLAEVWKYRDLIIMFIKRDFIAQYKQTILGPLWFFLQPLITTLTYIVVFGKIANLSSDGQPRVLFYLSGILFWNYFSTSFIRTSETFSANAGIFGKVYFPRLTVPLATVCSALLSFAIQLLLFSIVYIYEVVVHGYHSEWHGLIFILPLLIIIMAALALGTGIIISSLTIRYRDLKYLVTFGIQLLMFATPVVYPVSAVKNPTLSTLLQLNPMTAIIETFRYAILGSGDFSWPLLGYAAGMSFVILIIGIVLFNRVEKTFMDTI